MGLGFSPVETAFRPLANNRIIYDKRNLQQSSGRRQHEHADRYIFLHRSALTVDFSRETRFRGISFDLLTPGMCCLQPSTNTNAIRQATTPRCSAVLPVQGSQSLTKDRLKFQRQLAKSASPLRTPWSRQLQHSYASDCISRSCLRGPQPNFPAAHRGLIGTRKPPREPRLPLSIKTGELRGFCKLLPRTSWCPCRSAS